MPKTILDILNDTEIGIRSIMKIILTFIIYRMTTDFVVGAGLIVVLFAAVNQGAATELQTTIASGLVGFLGRSALDATHTYHTNIKENSKEEENKKK